MRRAAGFLALSLSVGLPARADDDLRLQPTSRGWNLNCHYLRGFSDPKARESELAGLLERVEGFGKESAGAALKDFFRRIDREGAPLESCSIELGRGSQDDALELSIERRVAGAPGPSREHGRIEAPWSGADVPEGALTLYEQDPANGAWTRRFQYWRDVRERIERGRRVTINRGQERFEDAVELRFFAQTRDRSGDWRDEPGPPIERLEKISETVPPPRVPWEARTPPPPSLCGAHVDLSEQFPGPSRRQDISGPCHAFGAVGVLEAALWRHYRERLGGKRLALSEWDLFGMNKWDDVCSLSPLALFEGQFAGSDLQYAVENGVATAQIVPYETFKDHYVDHDKSFRSYGEDSSRRKLLQRSIEAGDAPAGVETADDWMTRLKDSRAAIKDALQGFEAVSRHPAGDVTGALARNMLVENLCAGRPAAVCLHTGGLREWGHPEACFFAVECSHCVVVRGYRKTDRGLEFLVRNSWGASGLDANPPIPEQNASRIFHLAWIEGPLDRGKPFEPPEELVRRLRALAGGPGARPGKARPYERKP